MWPVAILLGVIGVALLRSQTGGAQMNGDTDPGEANNPFSHEGIFAPRASPGRFRATTGELKPDEQSAAGAGAGAGAGGASGGSSAAAVVISAIDVGTA